MVVSVPHLLRFIIVFILFVAISGCAVKSARISDHPPIAFATLGESSDLERYAPIVISERYEETYNRIGTVRGGLDAHGKPNLYVDAESATFYSQEQLVLSTNHERYLNLIYRFHFTEVPFQLFPFTLTAGRQGGLIVIITLDAQKRPVLVTTVHTCGCYLAIVPTSYLPNSAYPSGWNVDRQRVYGETLPGKLEFPATFEPHWRPLITVRDATHRVANVGIVDSRTVTNAYRVVPTAILPASVLDKIPLPNGESTSFFHKQGWRNGYVKGSIKPWEFLFVSWWALDPFVGVDKALGDPNKTGVVFYTSLKPWYRQSSNLWYFAEFLTFWGWNL